MILCVACSANRDYGTEYHFETDCQYSYHDASYDIAKSVQSDGEGQYLFYNGYIYYHNAKTDTTIPLCNKPNCLHDHESDKNRQSECNAYVPSALPAYIQYYDGYVYYVYSNSDSEGESSYLIRVKQDGSKKDCVLTTQKTKSVIQHWLIHRGYFYYEIDTYFYGKDTSTQIYHSCELRSLPISSHMNEKNSNLIYKSDQEYSALGLGQLQAYKNCIYYQVIANKKDYEFTDHDSWVNQLFNEYYQYNTESGKNSRIPIPEGHSDTTRINAIVFLKDKMIMSLYDELMDKNDKLPIYSMNYDFTDKKIWLENVEQGKWVQSYDDFVILSDGALHYTTVTTEEGTLQDICNDKIPHMNVEIYSSDAKPLSNFVYPINQNEGNFSGFGPDGVNVEFQDNDDGTWSVYELNLNDVLNCSGEEVKLNCVGTRKYGVLYNED
jgi:hypothetical protein